jgi:hypothetical protein
MDRWQLTRFWKGFTVHMGARHPAYAQWAPSEGKRQIVPPTWFGGAARIAAGVNWDDENTIQVDLTLNVKGDEPLTKEWYRLLVTDKSGIRGKLITSPDDLWKPDARRGKPESWIVVKTLAYPEEKYWVGHFDWLANKVHRFHEVLGPLIQKLPPALPPS